MMNRGRPRIAILTDYLLHPTNDAFLLTSENLSLLKLGRLIQEELGWEVDLYQVSPIPERRLRGLRIIGLDAGPDRNGMYPQLNFEFARAGLDYDLRIYHHWHIAFPQVCHRSIVVSHGVFWDSPAGVFNRQNPVGRREWEKRLLYAVSAPAAFVVQDRNTANVINALWPGYSHRLCYIPPGVDLELFKLPEPRPGAKPIRVACPQDFGTEQGLNEILSLCETMAGVEPDVEFHILGRLTEFATANLLALRAHALPNCRFYWVPIAHLPRLYQSFDLALLPYRASVGASLHCLQALACGLPVVAGLAGGLSEMVVDGWNGRLVAPGSARILQEAMVQLVRDGDLRTGMSTNARRLAEGYPEPAWRERWRWLLEQVLGCKDPGGELKG